MPLKPRTKLFAEPPAVATGDIAFNLIVFFLVCASSAPDSGRHQNIPASETAQQEQKIEHIEVRLDRATVVLNGDPIYLWELAPRLRKLLAEKTRPEDKIVIVKSKPETPYHHWIRVTAMIEEAGGTITIQREEEREVRIPD
jgi:biopolymer transport protein ExbD